MKISEKVCAFCKYCEGRIIDNYFEDVCTKDMKNIIIDFSLVHTCDKWVRWTKSARRSTGGLR